MSQLIAKISKLTIAVCACALICTAVAVHARSTGQATASGPMATKATVEVKDASGVIALKRPEQIAFIFVAAIIQLEGECGRDAGGPCTIAQLVAGPKPTGSNTVGKLKYDPTKTDPNYTYKITINGSNWELWVTPKAAGLGGFYVAPGMMSDTYYNPKGAASNADKKLTDTGITGDIFFIG